MELKSFILTMWYVNNDDKEEAEIMNISFILTMWYVNLVPFSVTTPSVTGFILTMWYVNHKYYRFIILLYSVLY